jgi:hypothetical protein
MQVIHCDMEECKAAEPLSLEAGHMMPSSSCPKGWAFLEWQADGKGESTNQSKLMAKYFQAITSSLPKRPYGDDPADGLRQASELLEAAPDALLTLRAFICPKCLGKMSLSGFNIVGRAILAGGLFG